MVELLDRAAADGHTALPWSVAAPALAASGAQAERLARDAVASGEVTAVLLGDTRALALSEHVAAEKDVADVVGQLTDDHRLRVRLSGVDDQDSPDADTFVLGDAHRLGSVTLAQRLKDAPATATVTLMGDPDLLGPFGAGAPFRDIVAAVRRWSPGVSLTERVVRPADDSTDDSTAPIRDVVASVRRGELPAVHSHRHSVVVAAAPDDPTLARRVGQLVTDSIPRVFGLPADQIAVVTPLSGGPCGASALHETLAGQATVRLVRDAEPDRWAAVVAVYPAQAAGVLSRPLVLTGMTRARHHLSLVVADGCDIAAAVARLGHRPRTTILPSLLAQLWSPAPHHVDLGLDVHVDLPGTLSTP